MNARRPFVYVLLSLLLVLSQQMGYSHALTHWSNIKTVSQQFGDAADSTDSADVPPAKSLAMDQACEQCLAFAQIGTAVHSGFHSFPISRDTETAFDTSVMPAPCRRTVCAFHSRAPPALS